MSASIDVTLINSQLICKKKKYDKIVQHTNSESKILLYDFFSINEINISKKIKNISNNVNCYDTIRDYNFIDISKIDENLIENIDLNENKKYIIIHYNNQIQVDFQDFLFNLSNIILRYNKNYKLDSLTLFGCVMSLTILPASAGFNGYIFTLDFRV